MQGSLKELAQYVTHTQVTGTANFTNVSTDSRKVSNGDLFVALRGEKFDAHDFLSQVANSGAVAVVVEELPDDFPLPALIVPNTLTALGEIANKWRVEFNIPIIGVTGSNGKTTVKEMISSILSAAFTEEKRLTTQGNLNNEIGVPLTIMRLKSSHEAAVIEMGMNHPGEISRLTKIAMPTVGLVNNAQREHQEFMHTVEAVARENGSVFEGLYSDGIAVFPGDNEYTSIWKEMAGSHKIITFGMNSKCDVYADIIDDENKIIVNSPIGTFNIKLAVDGHHNVLNALAAITCCIAVGVNESYIVQGLENFKAVNGRLQRKIGKDGVVVIDDTYNANPDSVIAAIDVLAHTKTNKILVLGDMGEVGNQGEKFHIEIANYAIEKDIQEIFVIGDLTKHMVIDKRIKHFEKLEYLLEALNEKLNQNNQTTVLVKGSRFMKMEQVVNHLISKN